MFFSYTSSRKRVFLLIGEESNYMAIKKTRLSDLQKLFNNILKQGHYYRGLNGPLYRYDQGPKESLGIIVSKSLGEAIKIGDIMML